MGSLHDDRSTKVQVIRNFRIFCNDNFDIGTWQQMEMRLCCIEPWVCYTSIEGCISMVIYKQVGLLYHVLPMVCFSGFVENLNYLVSHQKTV